ncbi:DUF2637 domain-containing protein, partial [Saccharomonospora iraqiensis]|uniref:DUF2637 domain-containing protein n=1 Tax=Saccharomonospora iraqiensis TaxID=52698 RepID=UPI0013789029
MKRGWITWCGLGIVAAAAAVLSFDALRELAVLTGTPKRLAPLVPITIDAAALVGTRVWLAGEAPGKAVRFARFLALAMIGVSVVGNASAHALVAYDITPAWWAVVAVASVPPLVLGAVAHLAHLATGEGASSDVKADIASSPATGDEAGDLTGSRNVAGHGPAPGDCQAENFLGSQEVSEAENFAEVSKVSEPAEGPVLGDHQAEPDSSPGDRWAEHNGSPGARWAEPNTPPAEGEGVSARSTPGDATDLVDRARRLVAEHGRLGRGRLARELGVT